MQSITLTDNDLLIAIKNGDKSAYQHVFHTYYKYLCNFAFNIVKDKDSAEEIVQEIFYILWDKHSTIEIHTSLKAYLFRAVQNKCINQLKHIDIREKYKEYNQEQISHNEQQVDDAVSANELAIKINEAINELPTERKRIFILSRKQGLKNREIAETLDISIKTVENQMGKALKFLREKLEDYLPFFIIGIMVIIKYLKIK